MPEIEKLTVRKQPFDFLTFEEADLFMITAKQPTSTARSARCVRWGTS